MNPTTVREAISGPSALSRWSVIILVPLGVLAYFASNLQPTLTLNLIHFAAVLGGELLALFVGLAAWATVMRPTRTRHSLTVTLVVFAFIGVARGVGIDAILALLGDPSPYSTAGRAAISALIGFSGLAFVSIATNFNRASKQSMCALRDARLQIEATTELAEHVRQQFADHTLKRVTLAIDEALNTLLSEPKLEGNKASTALENLSAKVIRPMSHTIASQLQEGVFTGSSLHLSTEGMRQPEQGFALPDTRKSLLSELRYPNPLLVFVITTPAVVLFLFGGLGPVQGLPVTITSLATLALCCLALSEITRVNGRLRRSTLSRVGLIYALVGAVTVGSATVQFWVQYDALLPGWFGVVLIAGVATGLSLSAAHFALQQKLQRTLAEALRDTSDAGVEAQRLVDVERNRLTKLLHADIQGELIASAWRIRGEAMQSRAVHREIARLSAALATLLQREPERELEHAQTKVERLIRLWRSAVPIDFEASAESWANLDHSTKLTESLLDVLSEALTNAVRHGSRGRVVVRLEQTENRRVRLTVANRGVLRQSELGASMEVTAASTSMGLSRIHERARSVQLTQQGTHVLLVVEL